jgi:hypothetical protein
LERFLARIAVVGPTRTPEQFAGRESRLAYAINVYNAAVLRSVMELAKGGMSPRDLPAGFEHRFRFRVDGRWTTPGQLRKEALALAADDWRVRLALCDGHLIGPPLPRRVILPDLLDGQLNEIARTALTGEHVVAISHGEYKQLQLCDDLYDAADRLVTDYERRVGAQGATMLSVLLEWSDRPRRETLNSAVGYEVARLRSTGQSNAVEPPPPEGRQSVFSKLASFSLVRPSK